MRETLFFIFVSNFYFCYSQNEFNSGLVGSWEESEVILTDFECKLDTSKLYFDDLEYQFLEDSTFIESGEYFCDGEAKVINGTWHYLNVGLYLTYNQICEKMEIPTAYSQIYWYSEDIWYVCGKDGDNYYIYAYRRIEDS